MRKCEVNGEKAYFHKWITIANVVPPSPRIGGTPGGQIQYTLGLIETKDGEVRKVEPSEIRFTEESRID